MYRNFFSLSELPFSISPNPKYLFMSERHKEALAHLTYGLGDVGGFALLTGEVGTGKTTISRRLMEQLPDNTQAAFILNPMLSSQELLATLCDELKIRYRKTGASLKTLTDKIADKLKNNNNNNINTLLIIDEAQHLQPEVLEQLRLLTNLETNTKKLLQVILIGQPELQQLLQRRDLRQLAQRITARYHLLPLTPSEQGQYIQHRLLVADCTRALFDKGALKKIHQLSQGIPRLTNLLCHSALMQAYNQNDSVVNKKTVALVAETVLGNEVAQKTKRSDVNQVLVAMLVLTIISCIGLMSYFWGQHHAFDKVNTGELRSLPSSQSESAAISPAVSQASKLPNSTIKQSPLTDDEAIDDNVLKKSNIDKSVATDDVKVIGSVQQTTTNVVKTQPIKTNSSKVDTAKNHLETTTKATPIAAKPNGSVKEPKIANTNKRQTNSVADVKRQNQVSRDTITQSEDYALMPVEGISSELLARFQMAIDETRVQDIQATSQFSNNDIPDEIIEDSPIANQDNDSSIQGEDKGNSQVKPLSQMSQEIQNAIPALQFEQHIYASDGSGWVNINGRDRYEGDYIADGLKLNKILPQRVILSYQGKLFSLSALTNWQ
jgi:type II secretory pathway predicted ATPase ExeA